ncbi:MAG: hypothetical protein AAB597_00605 [Patescibacteria group bacterium]
MFLLFRKSNFLSTELLLLTQALLGSIIAFSFIAYTTQIYAAATSISVTVQSSMSFSVSTNQFANITPGTARAATTTLNLSTNNANGWNVILSGDNKNTSNQNLQLSGETTTQITDQTEWVPGAATTSAGNAARISSLVNSNNVLAFRVMSASSTNGVPFFATTWWGTADSYLVDNAATLWAGIASSTVSRQIGNAGVGSYSASEHVNTVQYYLNVASTQKTGTYSAPLTYTATAN